MDRNHNPEFTMLELYVPYKDYNWMMNFVEELFEYVCLKVFNTLEFEFEGEKISFERPWKRVSMIDKIQEKTGLNVLIASLEELKEVAKNLNLEMHNLNSKAKLIDEIFSSTVEVELIAPTFVVDYPIELSPLAKKHRTKEGVVERFEAYVVGKEICNAFSELNDPIDQRQRFEEQLKMKELGDEEAHQLDEDFLRALEYGMPPTAGLGIGIDRLTMILTNQSSIRDVIFFPLMKPESN